MVDSPADATAVPADVDSFSIYDSLYWVASTADLTQIQSTELVIPIWMYMRTTGASFPPVVLMGSLLMMRELMVLLTRPPGLNTRLPCMSQEIG